jgi:hypothetical protein
MAKFLVNVGWYFYDDTKRDSKNVANASYIIEAANEQHSLSIIEDKLNLTGLVHPMYYGACSQRAQ